MAPSRKGRGRGVGGRPELIVENPARTAHYHAVIAERRAEITTKLDEILPGPHPTAIVWELGSGHGHFLTAYAQPNPQEPCVGIDRAGERVERALRKKNRARLPNLDFFQAEG